MIVTGPLLPFAALAAPLLVGLAAALPALRPRAIALLPLAPLPALAAALAYAIDPIDAVTVVPDLLLGVTLGLDAEAALLLGAAAFLWLTAGLYAAAYMRETRKPAVFAGFWCLTLAGNLGVFLARDVATFYVAFAAVSLAAYILVVHDGTARALRAGRVYVALAVIAEASLLAAFMIGAAGADSLLVDDVRAAIAASPLRDVATALLVLGFGLKAGLVPLHVWLPLAHPAAPTPASAVLSGAIVKAGIFGLILFLPAEMAAEMADGATPGTMPLAADGLAWGVILLAAGIASAWFGVLAGLTRSDPKAVLAYSTVSQMGLVIALVGLAAGAAASPGEGRAALSAAAFYAAHHGLAKGALFLAVGVIGACAPRRLPLVLAVTALVALSVAGLPMTGGALAKAALKAPFGTGTAALLVTVSATGTALLLLRFLLCATRDALDKGSVTGKGAGAGITLPWLATAAAALLLPWILLPAFADIPRGYALAPGTLWAGLWPIALAAPFAALLAAPFVGTFVGPFAGPLAAGIRRLRLPSPRLPADAAAAAMRAAGAAGLTA
ncbi:MAG: complex I subunit 5 family protein, partial [Alphaproteobacteria bacterium]